MFLNGEVGSVADLLAAVDAVEEEESNIIMSVVARSGATPAAGVG